VLAASIIIALMKAANTSKSSVDFYPTTRRKDPKTVIFNSAKVLEEKLNFRMWISYSTA
jgi:hypothetical protein